YPVVNMLYWYSAAETVAVERETDLFLENCKRVSEKLKAQAFEMSKSNTFTQRFRSTFASQKLDLYGEFDPGSGRTLAACLIHASRAELSYRSLRVEVS